LATLAAVAGTCSAAARAKPALVLAASDALWMPGLSWSCDRAELMLVGAAAAAAWCHFFLVSE
jgi:hypothetical protein